MEKHESMRTYICIDLKSFYASVECIERGLDPLKTNLVVADSSRTEKTICLAVTPSLKAYGVSGRSRLFEVIQKVKEVNAKRAQNAPGNKLSGSSSHDPDLRHNPSLALDFLIAPPRMAHYIEYSTRIYDVYLKYIAPEDIHVYSIDEVFMDITNYLPAQNMTPYDFAKTVMADVMKTTGITATAGIGPNMYLAKIAMDITAKHIPADEDGVRIAVLDEQTYREKLWNHRPITDFWRIGKGYANKLQANGMYTMGDVARCSVYNEDLLYKLFGINAELLIDHAWGYEPCTIEMVKSYKPATTSLSSGQVLQTPYSKEKAKLVTREMTELLVLDLVDKRLVTNQLVLTIGYDIDNLLNPTIAKLYKGDVTTDSYGRKVPKHAHGTVNTDKQTSSTKIIVDAVMDLYERIVDDNLLVRRITLAACKLVDEKTALKSEPLEQMNLFEDYEEQKNRLESEASSMEREKRMQQAMIDIKKKYGKNAILKGMNLEEGATAMDRNRQIGGHRA